MADYDAAEVRRVLKLHGHEVPERGKLSAANTGIYEQIIAEDGDYSGGVTTADFGLADPLIDMADIETGPAGAGDPAEEVTAERTPRGAGPRPAARARSLLQRGGDRGGGRRARPKRARTRHDWMPTGPVIERMWGELAWSARRLPPIQRIMAAQAPMVGVVLQDTARDTIFDRGLLQPIARGEEKLEAVNAVFGPLLWTTAIVRFGGFDVEPVLGGGGAPLLQDGQPVMRPVIDPHTGMPAWNDQTRVMIGGLRFSLMSWLRVGQRHAEEIIARAEELDELGDQADALIAFILSPPRPGQSFKDMQREARQRAGVFLHDEATGEPEDPGDAGGAAMPEPATPGHPARVAAALAVRDPGSFPYGPAPDPRTLGFLPPDPHTASQVVPRAPMPQA
jgi:hypothetical protein